MPVVVFRFGWPGQIRGEAKAIARLPQIGMVLTDPKKHRAQLGQLELLYQPYSKTSGSEGTPFALNY
jgi:hypothetical protein